MKRCLNRVCAIGVFLALLGLALPAAGLTLLDEPNVRVALPGATLADDEDRLRDGTGAQAPVFGGDIRAILQQTREDCERAWSKAHRSGDPERYDWIIEAVRRLYAASGGTVGGNWRRAVVGDLSMDGITVLATDGRYYFADVIVAAGSASASVNYRFDARGLLRDAGGQYAPQGFAAPQDMPDPVVPCGAAAPPPTAPPPPVPTAPAVDLQPVLDALAAIAAKVDAFAANGPSLTTILDHLSFVQGEVGRLQSSVDALHPKADQAAHEALQAAIRASEILTELRATPTTADFPEYVGTLFGRPIVLRPRQ